MKTFEKILNGNKLREENLDGAVKTLKKNGVSRNIIKSIQNSTMSITAAYYIYMLIYKTVFNVYYFYCGCTKDFNRMYEKHSSKSVDAIGTYTVFPVILATADNASEAAMLEAQYINNIGTLNTDKRPTFGLNIKSYDYSIIAKRAERKKIKHDFTYIVKELDSNKMRAFRTSEDVMNKFNISESQLAAAVANGKYKGYFWGRISSDGTITFNSKDGRIRKTSNQLLVKVNDDKTVETYTSSKEAIAAGYRKGEIERNIKKFKKGATSTWKYVSIIKLFDDAEA